MRIEVHHRAAESESYRAARVRSLFNVDSADVEIRADLPIEGIDWSLGLIVGPSGSGKTSLGARIFSSATVYEPAGWPADAAIVEAIAPDGDIDAVTGALAAVGLGTVPAWLRPYRLLSNGERFRADLARIICERPAEIVIDEFTSVVDRQIARVGALAFGKAWRRTGGRAVLLSRHYDIIDWLQPDWIYDTATGRFSGRGLRRRPAIRLDIHETGWEWWPRFEQHHYLKLPRMIAATCYVGFVEGAPVAHVAFSTRPGLVEARASRLVIMPEWQGAGIGMRFLNELCGRWRRGLNRHGKPLPTLFHTTHPGLVSALRRDPLWVQVSSAFWGGDKRRSAASMRLSGVDSGQGYGGHWRAVRGFRYIEGAAEAATSAGG
jgi:GNAT superfamily N-acetyltransferase